MGNISRLEVKKHEANSQNLVSMTRKPCCSKTRSSQVDRVLFLQRTMGNQAVQRLMKSGALQAKLRIGAPGDVYEQEAERVADAVMRMSQPQAVSSGTPSIQRACLKCEEEEQKRQTIKEEDEEEKLQRKPIEEEEEELQVKTASGGIPELNPDLESNIQSLKGGGQPLDPATRAFFEPRFGQDFGGVRVHTDGRAAEVARGVDARAFAMGRDVVFGEGQYQPETSVGKQLLAHEMAHIVQQGIGVHPRNVIQKKDGKQTATPIDTPTDAVPAGGVPEEVIEHLKLREGWREEVYLDSLGLATVGLGHLLTETEKAQYKVGDKVPVATLKAWAQADAKKAYDAGAAQASIIGVSDQKFINAMASVNFQLGSAWNTIHKKTWAYMVAHEWEKSALEAQNSSWYTQTPIRVQDFQAVLRALSGASVTATKEAVPAVVSGSTYEFKIGASIGQGRVTVDSLNVRKGPGTNYDKTGMSLQKGTSVTIYGQVNGWNCIGAGQWVSGQFISIAKQETHGNKEETTKSVKHEQSVGSYLKEKAQNVWDALFGGSSRDTTPKTMTQAPGKVKKLTKSEANVILTTLRSDKNHKKPPFLGSVPWSDDLTAWGGWCATAMSRLFKDMTGLEKHGNAKDWDSIMKQAITSGQVSYNEEKNPVYGSLPDGSVLVWTQGGGGYGHVCIVVEGLWYSDFYSAPEHQMAGSPHPNIVYVPTASE
jgi:GH24 family phage-related lysozyme (muramidase)